MQVDLDVNRLKAINEAIWIREHSLDIDKEVLSRVIENIGEYHIFSAKQIQLMTGNTFSRQKISQLCQKSDKTGGNLQVADLEKIRDLLYGRTNNLVNYDLVRQVIANGTSQGMLSKLTGIPQSSISRAVTEKIN